MTTVTTMTTVATNGLATEGFARDLEGGDQAQLLWYSADASVSIVNWGQPATLPRILVGSSAIGNWIAQMATENQSVRVVYHVERDDEMTVIAECRKHDGTLGVYSCTAQLENGLIVAQQVVLL